MQFIRDLLTEAWSCKCSSKTSWSPTIWARKKGVYIGQDKSDFFLAGMYLAYFHILLKS
jgi:hypothetical protein